MENLTRTHSPRFHNLLTAEAGAREPYDSVLAEIEGCVIAPTLGSILPRWLLVVPRRASLNFVEWSRASGVVPDGLIRRVAATLKVDVSTALWFEHGPSRPGSHVGCGVDYAHIHIIIDPPFSLASFKKKVAEMSGRTIFSCSAGSAYDKIGATSYLVAGQDNDAFVIPNAEGIGSQFFRKVVANLIEAPHSWDYKVYPHFENVEVTIRMFTNRSAL